MQENSENKTLFLEYDLTEKDISEALKTAQLFKTDKRKILYTVLLSLCAAANAFFYFYEQRTNGTLLFLATLCLIFTAVVWLVPYYFIKRISQEGAAQKLTASFGENAVTAADQGGEKTLPYNTCEFTETENLFVFYNNEKDVIAVPVSACTDAEKEQIRAFAEKTNEIA